MVIENGNKKSSVIDVKTILVNDFGDAYHRLDNEPSSDLERSVRKIRRRYRAFDEYRRAMGIYVEYMDALAEKYGGWKTFEARMASNTVFDYIPPLPKLKKTPINEFVMKHKIMISDPNRLHLDEEAIEAYEQQFEDELVEGVEITNRIVKGHDKVARKLVEEGLHGKLNLKKMREIDAVDILASYFDSGSTKKGSNENKQKKLPSVTDILEGNVDEDEDDSPVFYRGRLLTKEELKEMQFYQKLNDFGWNSLVLMKQQKKHGGGSSAIENVLLDEKYKQKRDKKNKKKNKKADEFLIKMMGDNDDYETFGEFEDDMLNYTINNVFK